MNTVQERLRYYRVSVLGLSLREMQSRVNRELGPDEALSLGTLSNYERPPERGSRRAGPRAEFLAALKRAFPDLRVEWLILGEGAPGETAQRLAAPGGLDTEDGGIGQGFAGRVLDRYPDLELLSPEASAVFMAALTRFAMGEPERALGEEALLDLAGDLRWLVLLPLGLWGFRHAPPYDVFSDYCVGMLHALMLLMPAAGGGDPLSTRPTSGLADLREQHPVGF